jgi:plasmid stabilization system protein ParE
MIERIFKNVETLSKFPERGRKDPEANREKISEVFDSEYGIICWRIDEFKMGKRISRGNYRMR